MLRLVPSLSLSGFSSFLSCLVSCCCVFSVFWIDSGVNVKFWMDSQRLPWFWFSERPLVGRVSLVGGAAAAVANVTSVATASCLGDSLIASFFAFCHLVLSLSLSLSRCLSLACCLSGFFFLFRSAAAQIVDAVVWHVCRYGRLDEACTKRSRRTYQALISLGNTGLPPKSLVVFEKYFILKCRVRAGTFPKVLWLGQ